MCENNAKAKRLRQLWQAKCSNIQFMLFLFNSIFHVQLFVQYSTFTQCSMLQFLSTRRLIFNYLFNVQLFIQHSMIYSMFNFLFNIQSSIQCSTFSPTFNYSFNIQLFNQHSIIHSVFNFLFNIQLFIQCSTFNFIFNFLEPSFFLVSEKETKVAHS